MTNWQVLQFSGNGSLDHEADTREAELVLVLPRPEEGIACFIFPEGALFCKAYFTEGSKINISSCRINSKNKLGGKTVGAGCPQESDPKFLSTCSESQQHKNESKERSG